MITDRLLAHQCRLVSHHFLSAV